MQNQKHTHRYQLNRKLVQKGSFERRLCLFVNQIAPWLRSEIELGSENLDCTGSTSDAAGTLTATGAGAGTGGASQR